MKSEATSRIQFAPGTVYHGREGAITHRFRYPILYIYFPIKEEKNLVNLFQARFKRLISFDSSTYLFGQHTSLERGVRELLKKHCNYEGGEIWLQTLPKMLGYVFNPVSFWYCFREEKLDAVLCEVRNTFGEKHFYFLRMDGHSSDSTNSSDWVRAEKVFHVSPFFPVEGHYLFKFELKDTSYRIQIKYQNSNSELLLLASTEGKYEPVHKKSLLEIFFQYGWLTLLVMLRIHYQAFWLWLKRAKFHKKPKLPSMEVSS